MLHHNVDYTPYAGMHLSSWPAMTISRGEIVWDGKLRGIKVEASFWPVNDQGLHRLAAGKANYRYEYSGTSDRELNTWLAGRKAAIC